MVITIEIIIIIKKIYNEQTINMNNNDMKNYKKNMNIANIISNIQEINNKKKYINFIDMHYQ